MQAVINNFVLCLRLLDLRHKINYVDTLNNYVVCSIIKARKAFASYRTTKVHFCLIFSLTVTNTTSTTTKTTTATNVQMNNNNNNVTSWGTLRDLASARDVTQRRQLNCMRCTHMTRTWPRARPPRHTLAYTHTHVWNGHFLMGQT